MGNLFPRRKNINGFLYYFVPGILAFLVYRVPPYLLHMGEIIPYYYNFISIISVSLLATWLFLEGPMLDKLPYLFYYYSAYKCLVFVMGILYDSKLRLSAGLYQTLDFVSYLVVFGGIFFFTKLFLQHPLKFQLHPTKFQTALMIFCPTSFFIFLQLGDPFTQVSTVVMMSIGAIILLLNLAVFYYLYTSAMENYDSRYILGKALTETQAQVTRYRYTVFMEEQARKERHELKNTFFYIQTLLQEKKYEQLESYITHHIGELSDSSLGISTNNILIDYIINTKLERARKNNIKTYTEILIPAELPVNEDYFCTILLNLLDNAIEASIKERNPDIQIFMNIKNNYLVCNIKNKVHTNILEKNPDFTTTKENKKEHGLGMKIIRDRVKKMNGIFDTSMDSNYFVATVMLPLEK